MAVPRVHRESSRASGWASLALAYCVGSLLTYVALVSTDNVSVIAKSLLSPTSMTENAMTPGWKSINVFYNKEEALGYPNSESFSQVGQDGIILDLVGENGFFIDLASNDAVNLSNTLALERKGWNGLCIEPNPVYWFRLSHRKCHVIGAPVGGSVELVDFKFSARGEFGGIEKTLDLKTERRRGGMGGISEKRYTIPLVDVLSMFHAPSVIDYLSLDVEGAEYLIMQHFPFEKYTIRVLTIERPDKNLKSLLASKGYVFLKNLSYFGETLWAHESMGLYPTHPKITKIKYFAT